MHASNYLENKLLDHVLGNTAFAQPSNLYMALYTADSYLEDGTPTAEIDAGGYSRIDVTNLGGYSAAVDGSSKNTADMEFPTATADWGTVTHLALLDAATGGNVLIWAPLVSARQVISGDSVRIRANAHTITIS